MNNAAEELLARRKARANIHDYMEYMKPTGLRAFEYPPAEHHDLLIDACHALARGDFDKYLAALPPGSAKSTYCSVIFVSWLLAQQPNVQIICAANTVELAENFSRQRRNIFKSDEWQKLSGTSLAVDAQSLSYQATEHGGGVYSVGAQSTVSGLRCDYAICDDLISGIEQANSQGQLEKLWDWYISELRSRLKPHGRQLVIGTRWSSMDVQGRLIELNELGLEDWHYLRLPMECDSANDPLNRRIGEPLWPEWFTDSMRKDAKANPQIWNCLYQQRPLVSSGDWVNESAMQIISGREIPKDLKKYIGVDIALSIQKGDWTVFFLVGVDAKKDIYILDCYRQQVSPEVSAAKLVAWCDWHKPATVFLDDDNSSRVWTKLVYELARKDHIAAPLHLVPMKGKDKETRAAPLRAYFLQGRVYMRQAAFNADLIEELLKFPVVNHDDQVDALSVVAARLMLMSVPKKPAPPKPLPIPVSMQEIDKEIMTTRTLAQLFKDNKKKLNTIQKRRI